MASHLYSLAIYKFNPILYNGFKLFLLSCLQYKFHSIGPFCIMICLIPPSKDRCWIQDLLRSQVVGGGLGGGRVSGRGEGRVEGSFFSVGGYIDVNSIRKNKTFFDSRSRIRYVYFALWPGHNKNILEVDLAKTRRNYR